MVYQDDRTVAFRDLYPKAPTHILIVPREHIPSLAHIEEKHDRLVAHILRLANRLAQEEGIADKGYRLVTNCGPEAGQSVPHLHFHLIGGKPLKWVH